ncbi:Os11g0150566, partial [Oryza sativa Japonica Group]
AGAAGRRVGRRPTGRDGRGGPAAGGGGDGDGDDTRAGEQGGGGDKHYFSGVVHFADAAGVYDAHFFDKIRQTESVLHPSIPFGFSLPFFFA